MPTTKGRGKDYCNIKQQYVITNTAIFLIKKKYILGIKSKKKVCKTILKCNDVGYKVNMRLGLYFDNILEGSGLILSQYGS